MKVVINGCYGGFSLSDAAFTELVGTSIDEYYEKDWGKEEWARAKSRGSTLGPYGWHSLPDTVERHDPKLVEIVERLGERANGRCANLRVVEIPDNVAYAIDEYDGVESIHEQHRSWS